MWGNLSNLKRVQVGGQWSVAIIEWQSEFLDHPSHSNLSDCIGPAPCEAAANSLSQRCRMQSPPELVKTMRKGCNHCFVHTFKTRLRSGLLQIQAHLKNINKCISAIYSPSTYKQRMTCLYINWSKFAFKLQCSPKGRVFLLPSTSTSTRVGWTMSNWQPFRWVGPNAGNCELVECNLANTLVKKPKSFHAPASYPSNDIQTSYKNASSPQSTADCQKPNR